MEQERELWAEGEGQPGPSQSKDRGTGCRHHPSDLGVESQGSHVQISLGYRASLRLA